MYEDYIVWSTGLLDAGKHIVARLLKQGHKLKSNIKIVDGNKVRKNRGSESGFSKYDREIPSIMTGIQYPYELPLNSELVLDTENEKLEESADHVMDYLRDKSLRMLLVWR